MHDDAKPIGLPTVTLGSRSVKIAADIADSASPPTDLYSQSDRVPVGRDVFERRWCMNRN
jgi:hypothetical protein